MKQTLQTGLTMKSDYLVTEDRTVPSLLPDADEFADMPQVLATGYMVALVELTCMKLLTAHLDDGERSVGIHLDLSHDAPTPPGRVVHFEVELTEISRRLLTFTVQGSDDKAVICRGTHKRAVIDLAAFVDRLR